MDKIFFPRSLVRRFSLSQFISLLSIPTSPVEPALVVAIVAISAVVLLASIDAIDALKTVNFFTDDRGDRKLASMESGNDCSY